MNDIISPSGITRFLDMHIKAVESCTLVNSSTSVKIEKDLPYNIDLLRECVDKYANTGSVAVVDQESYFEMIYVQDRELFYKYLPIIFPPKTEEEDINEKDAVEKLRSEINEYGSLGYAKVNIIHDLISTEMYSLKVITMSYLQRKLFRNAPFSRTNEPRKLLIKALEILESEEIIEEMSKEKTKELFDTRAKMYRIL